MYFYGLYHSAIDSAILRNMDHLNFIMRLEGEDHTLTSENIIDGVAAMIKDGTIWQLQGSYGRMGVAMIEQGYVDQEGNVLGYPEEVA